MNQSILRFFNGMVHKSAAVDGIASFLIKTAPFIVAAVIVAVFAAGLVRKQEKWRAAAFVTGCLVVVCLVLGFVTGHFVNETRPVYALNNMTALLPHADDSSFPSDHMLICFGAAFGFLGLRKWLCFTLAGFGLLVGLAKVYAAQHYPSDILVTVIFVFVIYLLYRAFFSKRLAKLYLAVEKRVFPFLHKTAN
ncbi:MAG: phosphatase PAP2 family protein [Defluviitaleaceae bacterium]|nr:phosphatase PAP2 family protein [Defluviitaleaceae bacterium]